MRTSFPVFSAVVYLLSAVVAFPHDAAAQAQGEAGPYAGVIGASDDANARHTLSLRTSVFGAWDEITETQAPNQDPELDRRFLRSGFAGGVTAGLAHARRTRGVQWLSNADTSLRSYGTDSDATAATVAGRSAVNAALSSRVTLSVSGGWTYSPYYELAPSYGTQFQRLGSFGGNFGLATAAERNTSTDGRAGLSVRLSSRDTISLDGNARYWDFLDQPDATVTSYGGGGRYRHSLTRALGVYAGWGREEARYEFTDDRVINDTIDVGVDYGDTLAFSRRTALSFGFSTSAVRWEEETHWRVNGTAALTRAFGRSGSGILQYRRATDYTGGFREPLLTDTFSGGFSDVIGRRTSWSVNVGYVRGEIGFDSDSPVQTTRRFDVYDAGGRITRALTRHFGIFGDYTFYRYEVPPGSTTFTFLPKFSRHSVSFGLTVWAPMINDTRPPRESRPAATP